MTRRGFTPLEAEYPAVCRGDECETDCANASPNVPRKLLTGFTLLEVLIVVAIIGTLGAAGVAYYRNYAQNVEVSTASSLVASALKNARSRAMTGQDERKWGVRFVNGTQDYYELFSTPTTYADAATLVESTEYLLAGVTLTDPTDSTTKDIIFSRIAGTTTAFSVSMTAQTGSATVSVSAVGTVY